MNLLRTLLIGGDDNLEKRNMVWNMLGSLLYAFASMVLSIVVIQVVGEDEGGIFSFAFSAFGQHMFMVAYFGMRPFHITDIGRRYTFGEYLRLRFVTCGGALVFGLLYVYFNQDTYTYVKTMTVILMVCYKVIDGFADVYEAEFQRDGRLYLTGKSNTFRTLFSAGSFIACLVMSHNLVLSCMVSVIAQILGVLIFNKSIIGELPQVDWSCRKGRCSLLFQENFLLFLSAIIDFYVFSASKYAIEGNMLNKDQAIFGAIFMPTSVINLVAGFVIRPYITKLSLVWENREFANFAKVVGRLAAIIAGLTVLALGGAWFLGIPVLSMLYPKLGYAIADSRLPLLLIILGGAFNAYINLFYYSLIIMQKRRHIFVIYALVAGAAFLISSPFVRWMGILGGALSYLMLMFALTVCFGLTALYFYRKENRNGRKMAK